METLSGAILEDCFRDENIKQKHKRNEDFLKLALTNVELARDLGLREGLTYDCTDRTYFEIRLPNNEEIFHQICGYDFKEAKVIVACHYFFLKNDWKVPVKLDKVVDEISAIYPPLTEKLSNRQIHNTLAGPPVYARKLFESDPTRNTVRPRYLPVRIEL